MRVVNTIHRYYPADGGAERHLHAINCALVQRGDAVHVATSDAADFALFWDRRARRVAQATGVADGVTVERFAVRPPAGGALTFRALQAAQVALSRLGAPVALLAALSRQAPRVPELWRWAATTTRPFDLVAGMYSGLPAFAAAGLALARRQHIPFVLYPLTHLGAGKRPGRDRVSRLYTLRHQIALARAADAVVAQTTVERDFFSAHGVRPARISVVGPGVDADAARGADGAAFRARYAIANPFVLTIGPAVADKGIPDLLRALRRLWAAGRAVDLVQIGAPSAEFARLAAVLTPAERARLHLPGRVSDADKRDALAAATIFALPSRTDSFGIVYLEAWLHGLPVIGARAWGVSDVITGGADGLLVPFGDVPALAAALADLLDDPPRAHAYGAAGRAKTLAQHTWGDKTAQIAALYTALVAQGGR